MLLHRLPGPASFCYASAPAPSAERICIPSKASGAQLGEGVRDWSVGDRAGVPWLFRACGSCEFCRRGDENLCPDAEFTGLHQHGGYAAYMLADARFAFRLPSHVAAEHLAPLLF